MIAGVLAASLLAGTALAQQQTTAPGVTSGPAVGTPATLGSGGTVPASPHQQSVVRGGGGKTIQRETQNHSGGPGQPGRPGAGGTESGKTPTGGTPNPK